jgi:hypothetical protein
MTFKQWLQEVDKVLLKKCFLTHMDLADAPYRDMYDADEDPEDAAMTVLVDYNDYPTDLVDGWGE